MVGCVRFSSVFGFLWLLRPLPSGAAALTVLACLYADAAFEPLRTFLAMVSILLISSATYAVNDYCDLPTDAINLPYRPLPSGTVAPKVAVTYALCAFVGGNVLSLLLGVLPFLFCMLCTIGAVIYSVFIKNILVAKNLFVAILIAGIFLFAGVVGHRLARAFPVFVAAVPFVFAREVLLDIRDVIGDERVGHCTIPVFFGVKAALCVVCCVLVLCTAFCVYLLSSPTRSWIDQALRLGFEVTVVAAVGIACVRGPSSKGWLTVSIQLLLGAMLVFVAGLTRIGWWR